MPLRGLGYAAKTAEADVSILRKYLEQFGFIPYLGGQQQDAVVLMGESSVQVRHSLGRKYNRGLIIGSSGAESFVVQLPDEAETGGLGPSVDTSQYFIVLSPAPVAADTKVSVWIW